MCPCQGCWRLPLPRMEPKRTMICQSTSTAKKTKKNQVGLCAPAPAPARVVADYHSQEWNQKKTMICQSTSTAKKNKEKPDWTMCPYSCPCQGCCRLPLPGMKPESSQSQMHHLTTRVLSISDERVHRVGLIFWSIFPPPQSPNPIFSALQHAATGFKTPTNRCCGMLQPLVLAARHIGHDTCILTLYEYCAESAVYILVIVGTMFLSPITHIICGSQLTPPPISPPED